MALAASRASTTQEMLISLAPIEGHQFNILVHLAAWAP